MIEQKKEDFYFWFKWLGFLFTSIFVIGVIYTLLLNSVK